MATNHTWMSIHNAPYLPPAVDTTTAEFVTGRALAAVTAKTGGWFWLPCTLCGIEYGGHEWGSYRTSDPVYPPHIPDEKNPPVKARSGGGHMGYTGICPFCTEARRGWDWIIPDDFFTPEVPADAQAS
jgi:hypothetical protein